MKCFLQGCSVWLRSSWNCKAVKTAKTIVLVWVSERTGMHTDIQMSEGLHWTLSADYSPLFWNEEFHSGLKAKNLKENQKQGRAVVFISSHKITSTLEGNDVSHHNCVALDSQIKVTHYSTTLSICLSSYWATDHIIREHVGMMCTTSTQLAT